ncbi:MAG: peptidase M28, partial [Betaproteobacteria bacterium]
MRAVADLGSIARVPHPLGSDEHRRVREYIVGRLATMGLAPEIQRGLGVNRASGTVAPVVNVVVRIPGRRGSGKAIVLVAHYDSVPT